MIRKSNKAITLIALVITIVIMLILAAVSVNLVIGNNGIIGRAKYAALTHKKEQYYQEIDLEIVDEHLQRLQAPKEEPFIVSLQKRLQGTETASEESVKVYPKKEWVDKAEINLRTILVVFTVEDYQILIDVDNQNNTATIRRDSFMPKGKEYTVTFDANTAEGSMEPISITQGLGIELPECTFTKTNYTFVGWYEDASCEGERYDSGEGYIVTEDKTLYAKWSQHAITITYSAGDGTGEQMSSSTIEIGEKDNLLANTYERNGYTFAGWKDQDDNSYTNGQEVEASKDLTLTAQWTPIEYTITYELDGGTATNPTKYTIETANFTLTNPTKTDKTFTGWSGTGLSGSANKTVTITKGSTGNRTYTANYESTKYTITYDLGGGELLKGVTNPSTFTKESGSITLNAPKRASSTFTGWTGSNGSTPQMTVTIPSGSTGNKTYTANWSTSNPVKTKYGYTSSSTIPWNKFKEILDGDMFDSTIVGAKVTDSNSHNWRIIKAGGYYYDLWYEASIGTYKWHSVKSHNASQGTGRWLNCDLRANLNGSTFYNNTSYLPTSLKAYVIQKEVVASVYWCDAYVVSKSDDYVWILTQTELNMGTTYVNVGYDGTVYSYFNSTTRKNPNCSYWTASSIITGYGTTWGAKYAGTSESSSWGTYVNETKAVVPAIRVQ